MSCRGSQKPKIKSYMIKRLQNNGIQRVMVSYKEIFSFGIQCFCESHNHSWSAKCNKNYMGQKRRMLCGHSLQESTFLI